MTPLDMLLGEPWAQYSDVVSDHTFDFEISWLVDTGITTGYSDGTFRPGTDVTRGSMAASLYRSESMFN